MIIRTEPKDFMMYSVLMYFNQSAPDSEDESIKSYLNDNALLPKHQYSEELDDINFEVFSFGGCYIGNNHMRAIADIQRVAVQRELLAEAIPALLRDGDTSQIAERLESLDENGLKKVTDKLVESYMKESSFGNDDEGYLKVTLDARDVQEKFLDEFATIRSEA